MVLTNRYEGLEKDDNFDVVYCDHTVGMELVTEHMLKQGCKNILLIAGAEGEQVSVERIQGYKTRL